MTALSLHTRLREGPSLAEEAQRQVLIMNNRLGSSLLPETVCLVPLNVDYNAPYITTESTYNLHSGQAIFRTKPKHVATWKNMKNFKMNHKLFDLK